MNHRRFLVLVLLAAITSACAPRVFEDPVPIMVDRGYPLDVRQAAAGQARQHFDGITNGSAADVPANPNTTETTDADYSPRYIAALHQLVWDKGHPAALRHYAIDELLRINPDIFRQVLARRIVLLSDWETVGHVLDIVVERGWQDMTAPIVRQYARPVHGISDADRVERSTLEKLHPGQTVEQVVFDVFIDSGDAANMTEQVAAWELLVRISEPRQLMTLLDSAPDVTPLVVDLKAGSRDLGVLPLNREGVLWLAYLRDPAQREFYDAAASAAAKLLPQQREGLELRHLPVLLELDASILTQDRDSLMRQLQIYLGQQEHYTTGPRFDGPMHDYPQYLQRWADQLVWADLASMLVIVDALKQKSVVHDLLEQADLDLQDTSTEYGGVIHPHDGGYRATLAKPTIRHHDRKFIPTDSMIERMYTGIAHYHLHAQEHRNTSFAGPGRGDLALANSLNFNGLVFTFINEDKLNVDFYRSDGIIVDLGVIER